MSAGKRKELRRQRRRLEDVAPVTFTTTRGAPDIEAALKDFLVLEASGWKGLAGTAIVSEPSVKKFRAGRGRGARGRGTGADRPAVPQRHRDRRHRARWRAANTAGAGRSPTTKGSPAPRPASSSSAISPKACSPRRDRARRFLRRRRSPDDRPCLARAARAQRPADRAAAVLAAVRARLPDRDAAPPGYRHGQGRARSPAPALKFLSVINAATRGQAYRPDQSASGKTMASDAKKAKADPLPKRPILLPRQKRPTPSPRTEAAQARPRARRRDAGQSRGRRRSRGDAQELQQGRGPEARYPGLQGQLERDFRERKTKKKR